MRTILKRIALCLVPVLALIALLHVMGFVVTPSASYTRLMMHELYTEDPPDVAFVGASRFYRGVDAQAISAQMGARVFTLASSSQDMIDSRFLMEEMDDGHAPRLVFLDVGGNRLYADDEIRSSQILIDYFRPSLNKLRYFVSAFGPADYLVGLFPGLRYTSREEPFFSAENLRNVRRKLRPEYRAYLPTAGNNGGEWYVGDGFVYDDTKLLGRTDDFEIDQSWGPGGFDERQLGYAREIAARCAQNGTRLVLLNMPVPLVSLRAAVQYDAAAVQLRELAAALNAGYVDLNLIRAEAFPRDDALFADGVHLNGAGAGRLAPVLARLAEDCLSGEVSAPDGLLYPSYPAMMAALGP